ncbi:MAG: winged helix-turn-helix domain-containing protein [Proteobacteria bacterium]|nr:winged helix-turn-helix domain-containing protein [Pseudomonadota bacterium]
MLPAAMMRLEPTDLQKPQPALSLRFGAFELRPHTRQLLADGVELPIGGRAFDLLQVLMRRHHEIVSSDELLLAVWPGQVVEPNNLQVQIWTLRKLLGPRAIATVARRGYRFVPELAGRRGGAEAARGPAEAASGIALPVLAVLRTHRHATLTGDNLPALLRLALACAHQLTAPAGGTVWQLDGSALDDGMDDARDDDRKDGNNAGSNAGQAPASRPPALLRRLPRVHSRPDILVLQAGVAPAPGLAEAIGQGLMAAPLLRVLAVAGTAIGLPQEQVLTIAMPAARPRPEATPLRWQGRGR